MGKALYRQYRSASFDEVIGQEHITKTLKNSLGSDSFAHAYLLTGPRGVGKTSVARILAYGVNRLPYVQDDTHLDIIEIDAASNRRIDEVRDLREKVHIAPTSAKYKVYIIDEVHMLTKEAFNALLKTLEEPPDHVIFILATTELHKLPDTIVSRCITFTFRPIEAHEITKHLKYIAKAEKINIADDALELLAEHGDGSFRDSISLLDQFKNSTSKVSKQNIESVLGLAPDDLINKILIEISSGNPKNFDNLLSEAYVRGANELNMARQLAAAIRRQLADNKLLFSAEDSLGLLKELLDVPASPKPRARLELCLLSTLIKRSPAQPDDSAALPEPEVSAPVKLEPELIVNTDTVANKLEAKVSSAASMEINQEVWELVLEKLKKQNNTLYSVARMAQAEHSSSKLMLSFKFPFHFKQINQSKNRSLISLIIDELGHKDLQLEIRLIENSGPAEKKITPPPAKKNDSVIENINNIFGEGEVLES